MRFSKKNKSFRKTRNRKIRNKNRKTRNRIYKKKYINGGDFNSNINTAQETLNNAQNKFNVLNTAYNDQNLRRNIGNVGKGVIGIASNAASGNVTGTFREMNNTLTGAKQIGNSASNYKSKF
jgi:hypothetical protein